MYGEAYNNLGVLYRDEGLIDEAIKCYEKCLAINILSRNAGQNRLLAMNCTQRRREGVNTNTSLQILRRWELATHLKHTRSGVICLSSSFPNTQSMY
jgi:tetratricopeptide (TPR) repeat protein